MSLVGLALGPYVAGKIGMAAGSLRIGIFALYARRAVDPGGALVRVAATGRAREYERGTRRCRHSTDHASRGAQTMIVEMRIYTLSFGSTGRYFELLP